MKKKMRRLMNVFARIVFGGLILMPISFLWPKKKTIIFITRFGKSFEGNLKYLFLWLVKQNFEEYDTFFLTEDRELEASLKAANLPVLFHPTFASVLECCRAGAIIVDGNEWVRGYKYQMLHAARKFQVWHGSGMKTVGLMKPRVKNQTLPVKAVTYLLGLHPVYDIVSFGSATQQKTRGHAFRFKSSIINGQPRNDILFSHEKQVPTIGVDVTTLSTVLEHAKAGNRVVLYAPTHRLPSDLFLQERSALNPHDWNQFAAEHNLLFVFKYHPKTLPEHEWEIGECENIIEYDKFSDVYPLLGQVDALITDYSSIFTDYILLNRPVVFFPFDYDRYVNEERALQFDYHTVTPGRKCMTQNEVFDELRKIVTQGMDDYAVIRDEMIRHFYDKADGSSCARMWKAISATW